ncbi:hypothetical protein P4639_22240 [Priestia megaterium]|uniref:hypothetical protein n=1 Tax=Priestia megaterium TaxID=1404 RepID=UPI002E1C4C8A|nr:hypothetical protein [Priestia megaterium]
MKASEFKEWLKEDIERIEKLLESIGCHRMWRTGDEIRCAPPNSENHTSVSVNVDTLYCKHYKEGESFRGDVLEFSKYIRNEGFSDTFRFAKSVFGLTGKFVKEEKRDPLSAFKKIRNKHKPIVNINYVEISKFGMETLEDFVLIPHINLFYEGIMPDTAELFKVGYDDVLDRIVFPHFHYENTEDIVGITGRTTKPAEVIEEFRIAKYWNYIKGYKKMYNLYGFSHSLPFVIINNMLIIFEAEKSVLKQFTQTRNEGFSCSVGGHEISDVQVQIILQNTPPEVEIVIAFDKDVMAMKDEEGKDIGEEYLIGQCNKFSKFRKTSYIFDTYNILGAKDSPIDKGYKIWQHLLKFRKVNN